MRTCSPSDSPHPPTTRHPNLYNGSRSQGRENHTVPPCHGIKVYDAPDLAIELTASLTLQAANVHDRTHTELGPVLTRAVPLDRPWAFPASSASRQYRLGYWYSGCPNRTPPAGAAGPAAVIGKRCILRCSRSIACLSGPGGGDSEYAARMLTSTTSSWVRVRQAADDSTLGNPGFPGQIRISRG